MLRATSLLAIALASLLCACLAGGPVDVCAEAADHVAACLGEEVAPPAGSCDVGAAETTLAADCDEVRALSEIAAADGWNPLCWIGLCDDDLAGGGDQETRTEVNWPDLGEAACHAGFGFARRGLEAVCFATGTLPREPIDVGAGLNHYHDQLAMLGFQSTSCWRSGQTDNPGQIECTAYRWIGMSQWGTTYQEEHSFETTELPPGRYVFTLTGDSQTELRVRRGLDEHECREMGPTATCTLDVTPGDVYGYVLPARAQVTVVGASGSDYHLTVSIDHITVPPISGFESSWPETGVLEPGETHRTARFLPAGRHVFSTSGSGDVDLYLRIRDRPDAETFDCRSSSPGASETCSLNLGVAADVFVLLRGEGDTASDFELAISMGAFMDGADE